MQHDLPDAFIPTDKIANHGIRVSDFYAHSAMQLFISSQEWAILPSKLEQIYAVVRQHEEGSVLALIGDQEASKLQPYQLTSTVAVISMNGTLVKRARGLSAISGVRTTIDIQRDIQHALDNPEVAGIVLDIDSPGGTVDGTKELADFVAIANKQKPIVTYANGLMASAAYWIGAKASKIVAYDTTQVGSIGVVIQHQDRSAYEAKLGVKTSFIYQGQYKVTGNPYEPLSDDSRAHIQSRIDGIYRLFVDAVVSSRKLLTTDITTKVANGATFLAAEAKQLGLIDEIGSLQDAIALTLSLIGERKMADMPDNVAASQVTIAELQKQLEALAVSNAQLTALHEEAAAKLAAKEAADAAVARKAAVTAKFEGAKVSDEFIAAVLQLEDAQITKVASEIVAKQSALDEVLAGLSVPTPGASTEHSTAIVANRDEAVALISTRDKCDLDTAISKAAAEYPEFFTV